jgi:hypothetical protein
VSACPKCGAVKVPSDRLDACGRPIARCPQCQGVVHHSSRPVDATHPSLAGRSQVVHVEAPHQPPPVQVVALTLHVPVGFLLRRAPGVGHTYVLIRVTTGQRTVFSARDEDVVAVLEREVALLSGRSYADVYGDPDEAAAPHVPTVDRGPHPNTLPSEHPRAVAWRLRIQRGRFRQDSWSAAEIEQLRVWYSSHGRSYRALPELAAILGRLPKAISGKAKKLGLTRLRGDQLPVPQERAS